MGNKKEKKDIKGESRKSAGKYDGDGKRNWGSIERENRRLIWK